MPTKRFFVVMGLVAAAAGAVLWVGWPAHRSDAARTARAEGEAARAPRAEGQDSHATDLKLALLQAQVTGLQAQLAGKPAPTPAPAAPAAEQRTPEEVSAAEAKAWHELIAQTEATFQAEARDPKWSQETSATFRAALMESSLLRAAFQNLDCRSSMCRVEMLDDRSPEFMTQLQNLILRVGPALPTMRGEHVTKPDGSKATIYYLSKES